MSEYYRCEKCGEILTAMMNGKGQKYFFCFGCWLEYFLIPIIEQEG